MKRRALALPCSVALAAVLPLAPLAVEGTARAANPQPYGIRQQAMMRRLSDPVASPDGKQIAFVLRSTNYNANRGRTDIYVASVDGGPLKQVTTHEENDSSPEWAPDGKFLYFLSNREGSRAQIFRVPAGSDRAEAVVRSPVDIQSFHVSPDGKSFVFAADVYPDCESLDCTARRLESKGKARVSGQVYDKLFVRHWDAWADGRRSHLFVVPVAGGIPRDLMKGMDADAPSKPDGGAEEYTFARDSAAVVFTARDAGRAEAWSTNLDLFAVAVDGKSPPRNLTRDNPATDTTPVFSPDGKTLAYLAMARPGFEADRRRVRLMSWPEGKERNLTEDWDRSPDSLAWSEGGKTLLATADDRGSHGLFAIDTETGHARLLVGDGYVASPQEVAGGRLVYAFDSLKAPADLVVAQADGSQAKAITHVNPETAGMAFGDYEQFAFKGAKGDAVYGYVTKPVNFDPTKKYPVALLIHGGPQGSLGNHFHYRWNPQVFAGHGYAVVMIDFHGSTGYGQAFTDSIRGDWGGKPLEDLKKGLAAATTKYAFLDEKRVAALGASYGGYMINWIAGNWSDRFRCLVNHDGNLDERMAYFDTEELWFPEWEHQGTPWDNPASYAKQNPIDHVSKWKTPMLVVHGGKDYRVVDSQGMATFTALQRKNIPSKFLYFPDENHWVVKPQNTVLWHDTVLAWLDQWTGATPAAPVGTPAKAPPAPAAAR